jgi:GH25 family lysozyme M1 (1,4-beta-N-acetylmuramidase)
MRRAVRLRLPFIVALLAAVVVLPAVTSTADAAASRFTANCATNLRTKPTKAATVVKVIKADAIVTAVATVSGGYWKADCRGVTSGRTWLKIVAVNGTSTSKLYGRSAVYAARGLFRSGPNPVVAPTTTTTYASNCSVRLRASASTTAATRSIIADGSVVTAVGTVTGGSWSALCGTNVSGNTWLKVTAVAGQSVSSLYGVSAVYAAKGLFRAVASSTSGYIEGIDVSKWQGVIDWAQVAAAGKKFAIAKATEGVGYEDPTWDRNKLQARANGLVVGAYHFARPSNNPVVEADWFVNTAGYERGMIVPTLDLEATGGLGPTALTAWTRAWLSRVNERLGVKPMIYASPSFWRTYMGDTRWFADNGYAVVWVAHWGVASPSVPGDNWGGRSWTFWQYTSDGLVPGIDGRVDLNRYRYQSLDYVRY